MLCDYKKTCTFYADAASVGGKLLERVSAYCGNGGNGCVFFKIYNALQSVTVTLPLIGQDDNDKADVFIRKEQPCWVFKKCPLVTMRTCPAYTEKKGKFCWTAMGTKCDGKTQGCFIDKIFEVCDECDFYHLKKSMVP